MKFLIVILTGFFLLSGCASKPTYSAAENNGYGYSHSQIDRNAYRIHFKLRGDNHQAANDYAMRRAAELTLEKGYDWFVVTDRQTLTHTKQAAKPSIAASQQTMVVRECGLLGCQTHHYPAASSSLGFQLESGKSVTESIVSIRMGKGIRPSQDNSFDALEVHERLSAQTAN